jgi:hypothetical protein
MDGLLGCARLFLFLTSEVILSGPSTPWHPPACFISTLSLIQNHALGVVVLRAGHVWGVIQMDNTVILLYYVLRKGTCSVVTFLKLQLRTTYKKTLHGALKISWPWLHLNTTMLEPLEVGRSLWICQEIP